MQKKSGEHSNSAQRRYDNVQDDKKKNKYQ